MSRRDTMSADSYRYALYLNENRIDTGPAVDSEDEAMAQLGKRLLHDPATHGFIERRCAGETRYHRFCTIEPPKPHGHNPTSPTVYRYVVYQHAERIAIGVEHIDITVVDRELREHLGPGIHGVIERKEHGQRQFAEIMRLEETSS